MEYDVKEAGKAIYTFTYKNVLKKAIEGILHVRIRDSVVPTDAGGNKYASQTIKITAFGVNVFNQIS